MKQYANSLFFACVALLAGTASLHAASGDPLKTIYRATGVTDSGQGTNVGRATAFHCTNFSSVTERLVIQIRSPVGQLLTNKSFDFPSHATLSASTHLADLFFDSSLGTGLVLEGFVVISSTSALIICNAMIVDAASTSVNAVVLPMVRFNPWPGSQE